MLEISVIVLLLVLATAPVFGDAGLNQFGAMGRERSECAFLVVAR